MYSNVFSHVGHYKKFNNLEYELFRNNKLIGTHKYNFIREKNNLTVKRPGIGISTMRIYGIFGQKAHKDFQENDIITLK